MTLTLIFDGFTYPKTKSALQPYCKLFLQNLQCPHTFSKIATDDNYEKVNFSNFYFVCIIYLHLMHIASLHHSHLKLHKSLKAKYNIHLLTHFFQEIQNVCEPILNIFWQLKSCQILIKAFLARTKLRDL